MNRLMLALVLAAILIVGAMVPPLLVSHAMILYLLIRGC
jgi:hypothetical protein